MILRVDKKTGYRSKSDYVLIYRGMQPFYHMVNRTGEITFNMMPGEYHLLHGEIEPLKKPIEYDFINKYKADFPRTKVKKLKIVVRHNPNKCSVDLSMDPPTAYIDPSLVNGVPIYRPMYTIGHEYGHNLFRGNGQVSERACDAVAVYCMLKMGLNPSQCCAAIEGTLSNSPDACMRKTEIYYDMKKLN